MADDQVNQAGDQGGTQTQTQTDSQPLGWRAGLPDNLKNHEAFTTHKTVGDLGKVHIEALSKVKELEGKATQLEGSLKNSIPKLPENPTKEQVDAYYAAIGRPQKPEDYKFEPDEGIEHDPNMVNWAKKVFWENGISSASAVRIQKEWDAFLKGVEQEEDKLIQAEIDEAQKKFRSEFKTEDEFKAALQLNQRYFKKMMGVEIPPFMDAYTITKFIYEHAKKYGEDKSLQGSQLGGAGEEQPGMIYDKTPQHQKR